MAIDWKTLKREYEKGAAVPRLAAAFKCHPSTVRKRAVRDGWTRGPKMDDHRALWDGVKRKLIKGLRHRDLKTGLEELKVAKVAGEVLASVIRGEKEALGAVDDGRVDEAREIVGEIDALTAPPGAEKALD